MEIYLDETLQILSNETKTIVNVPLQLLSGGLKWEPILGQVSMSRVVREDMVLVHCVSRVWCHHLCLELCYLQNVE